MTSRDSRERSSLEVQLEVDVGEAGLPRLDLCELALERLDLLLERQVSARAPRGVSELRHNDDEEQNEEKDALVGLADLGELPLAVVAREAQEVQVVLEQARAVRDGDEGCERRACTSERVSNEPRGKGDEEEVGTH